MSVRDTALALGFTDPSDEVISILEDLESEGYTDGYDSGYDDGLSTGYDDGLTDCEDNNED